MKAQVDFLIAGQGLAGTWLSFLLAREKKNVLIVDKTLPGAAWKACSGVFSPLTGQRAAVQWRAAELLELAAQMYPLLQKHIGFRVYYQMPVVRIFKDAQERRQWSMRTQDNASARWLSTELKTDALPQSIRAPHGAIRVNDTGYVHVPRLIEKYRAAVKQEGWLIDDEIQPQDVSLADGKVRWKDVEADHLIFCEGHRARFNPWFSKLPFQPTKGEAITLKFDEMVLRRIFHGAVGLVPRSDHTVRCGATYDRDNLDPVPTDAALRLLAESAASMVDLDMDVIAHEAGIRPNLMGHFPVVGRHPKHPQLSVFNGLGSKGVLLAPFCAAALTAHLVHNTGLPKEISIGKFAENLF